MIIVLKPEANEAELNHIIEKVKDLGLTPHVSKGAERTIIGVIGPEDVLRVTPLEAFPGVEKVIPVLSPFRLVSREFKKEDSVIDLGKGVKIGGKNLVVMAGPCSIENFDRLLEIGRSVKQAGACVLRGGAFKPRTSPYSFQGWARAGWRCSSRQGSNSAW
jgi:3-deoxy-7-phosphoheptulonate synthase